MSSIHARTLLAVLVVLLAGCRTTRDGSRSGLEAEPRSEPTGAALVDGGLAEQDDLILAPEAPDPRCVEIDFPEGILEGLYEGEARSVPVVVASSCRDPLVVLDLRFTGLARGARRLVIAGEEGALRAFGLIPPGTMGLFSIGIRFPDAGEGEVFLTVRMRSLEESGESRAMREITIPAEGEEYDLVRSWPVRVEALPFPREAAEAKSGFPAEEALFVRCLDAWLLRRGNETYLVSVADSVEFPGLSFSAAAFLNENPNEDVPILDERGRLQLVPRGPALRAILEQARMTGWTIETIDEQGRQILRVRP